MTALQIPLEFPRIYLGQFALTDPEREITVKRYSWGVRIIGDREHVIGRRPGERVERSLTSLATIARGFRFTHVNGDRLDCRAENLRCMNPKRYLEQFGHPYPGPTSEDPAYLQQLMNAALSVDKAPRKLRGALHF